MSKIKTKENVKDIKVLDKAAVASERMKTALIRSKDQMQNLMDDGQVSPSEYAEDKLRYAAEDVADRVGHDVSSGTKKAVNKGKEAYREHREEKRIQKNEERVKKYEEELRSSAQTSSPQQNAARDTAKKHVETQRANTRIKRNQTIKTAERTEHTIKQSARSAGKKTVKAGAKGTVKSTEKAVKTAEKTSKAAIKTAETTAKATQKAAEATAKAAQKAAEIARQTAIAAYKAAVAAAKAIAAAVKAIAAAIKELIAAIAAGGWVAVVVIVVICLIALIVGSCFGIFFSSEDKNDGSQTMREVVVEINEDYQSKLDAIKADNPYDELEMSGSRAVWPEVLSVYAVKTTTDPDNPQEVASVTEEKKQLYIETGVCPKYAGCVNGVAWFKEHNQWVDGSETPSPGMIIFYDWDSPNGESGPQDGLSDHTGIVERVENGIVYTVEGNSGDSCRQCHRAVGNYEILGYGVIIP